MIANCYAFYYTSHDIKVLIEGESLGNDATAVIAFFFLSVFPG
ncbi:MAG: hypothetical protein RBQ76_06495 [Sulfurovum sp.]|nr:hypothetical protein [Sulfurovum sp.]